MSRIVINEGKAWGMLSGINRVFSQNGAYFTIVEHA